MIVGLAVQGGARDALVRTVGPGLAAFGVSGAMADPQLELFRGSALVLTNNDWPATLAPHLVPRGPSDPPSGVATPRFGKISMVRSPSRRAPAQRAGLHLQNPNVMESWYWCRKVFNSGWFDCRCRSRESVTLPQVPRLAFS